MAGETTGPEERGRDQAASAAVTTGVNQLPSLLRLKLVGAVKAENATGNFVKVVQRVPVKIVLDPNQDAEHRLRPGLSVYATIHTR